MSGQKTTSSTIVVGPWTYIFLNKPDTIFIEFIRFKDPKSAQSGKVGYPTKSVYCASGPIDAITFGTDDGGKHIRLYYIGKYDDVGTKDKDSVYVREIKLENAQSDDTDPARDWQATPTDKKQSSNLKFERDISKNARLADETSLLSATVSGGNPVVIFTAAGEDFVNYAKYDGDSWGTFRLTLPVED